nr:PREDICTED: probable E3 SUMO-protein ligase RNF212 isoform X2 [Lepisosteus oculatus]
MPNWILCNVCFHQPSTSRQLAVTNCGHIICEVCFQKGNKDQCLVCKAQCKIQPLSNKSSPEVKALFTDIEPICKRYCSEITKVLEFQERHRKRLLAYYKQKSEKMEASLQKMKGEMQQMNKKIGEQKAYIAKLECSLQNQSLRSQQSYCTSSSPAPSNAIAASSWKQIPFGLQKCSQPSPTTMSEPMDVDVQKQFRKPEMSSSRISLISPPQDGHMGAIPHRVTSQSCLVANRSSRTVPVRTHSNTMTSLQEFRPGSALSNTMTSSQEFRPGSALTNKMTSSQEFKPGSALTNKMTSSQEFRPGSALTNMMTSSQDFRRRGLSSQIYRTEETWNGSSFRRQEPVYSSLSSLVSVREPFSIHGLLHGNQAK